MVGEMENNGGKFGKKNREKKQENGIKILGIWGKNGIKNGNLGFFDVFLRRICGFLR